MQYTDVALFSDLDGTLFDSSRRVSPENRAALARFIRAGGQFGISTGRAAENALVMLPDVPINAWSVVLNGAAAYHYGRKTTAAERELPKESMERLIRWVLAEMPEVNVQLCSDHGLLFVSRHEYADADFVNSHQPLVEMSLEDALRFRWLKVLFCAPRKMLEILHRYAMENGYTGIMESVYSSEVYLEFLPQGVSKGACLRELRKLPELKGKTFIAIGDYTNDLELLQVADVAVAVGNALPEVKEIADYIVCRNDDHAIADLIDRLIPLL